MKTRNKYSNKKPCFIITSQKEFDQIQSTDDIFPFMTFSPPQINKAQEQSIFPEFKIVQNFLPRRRFAKLPENYIKLSKNQIYPDQTAYQLTDQDLTFIRMQEKKFKQDDQTLVTQNFMKQAIVFLEKKCNSIGDQSKMQFWFEDFDKQLSRQVQQSVWRHLQKTLFNYWSSQRKQFCFPIYRMMWKKTQNISLLVHAYKQFPKKRTPILRDKKRMDKYLIKELLQEFTTARQIVDNISIREQLKLKKIQNMVIQFNQIVQPFTQHNIVELNEKGIEFYEQKQQSKEQTQANNMNPTKKLTNKKIKEKQRSFQRNKNNSSLQKKEKNHQKIDQQTKQINKKQRKTKSSTKIAIKKQKINRNSLCLNESIHGNRSQGSDNTDDFIN